MLSARSIDGVSEITWIDLEAASTDRASGWDKIERAGDLRSATTPTFSHDGTSVLYVSATMVTGGAGVVDGDLMTVPWSSRLGGQAMPVAGAHDLTWNEYTPSLTPDDRYIAYARVPYGQSSQSNPRAEILVVPQSGGAPARLEANDPPQCLGRTSPGIGNSWPRFSPDAVRLGSTTWYWMAFSSKRGGKGNAQIYVAAVIVDESQQPPMITSTPALYVWSQPSEDSNHTPSWEPLNLTVQ